MKQLLLENINPEETKEYIKILYAFLKSRMNKIDRDPKIFLVTDKENADDILGKTGYYDPEKEEIYLYVLDRHPKDILRSFAHEVIHHEQKCSGFTDTIDLSATKDIDYASKNMGLRKAEKDAFKRGNMFFRDWTDSLKVDRTKQEKDIMSEKIDKKKADLDKDGKLSSYEKKRGKAIQKNMKKKEIKKEEKSCSSKTKNEVQKAKKLARKNAAEQLKHARGKDIKEQEAKENLEESLNFDILFDKKERLLSERFNNYETEVYNELLKKFGIKNA